MSAEQIEQCTICKYHLTHSKVLDDLEKDIDKNDIDHEKLWTAIDRRVTNKLFYVLVALVISGLAFQWANYEKLSAIATRVAVMATKLDLHANNGTIGNNLKSGGTQ